MLSFMEKEESKLNNKIEKLASNILYHSCEIKKDDRVFIEIIGLSGTELLKELIKQIYRIGAIPFYELNDISVLREFMIGCEKNQLKVFFENKVELVKKMDAYIIVGAQENKAEFSDIPYEKMGLYFSEMNKVVEERLKLRYVVLKTPNYGMAQKMNRSLQGLEDFFYKVCNMDYTKLEKNLDNLKTLMQKTDKVRIVSEGTDLSFSIKGMSVVTCAGKKNLPDGEIFTAPIKESVNGHIKYNSTSTYKGITFTDVSFEFKDGKIIKSSSNNPSKLEDILNSDDGARYIGEFAIGVNPFIINCVDDILFDEKISGSIHFTPGQAYDVADNGNKSIIHWDLVLIMKASHGGGEIYFDDVLIQKDGLFVLENLKALNPESYVE